VEARFGDTHRIARSYADTGYLTLLPRVGGDDGDASDGS
jgi:hypothetical protein